MPQKEVEPYQLALATAFNERVKKYAETVSKQHRDAQISLCQDAREQKHFDWLVKSQVLGKKPIEIAEDEPGESKVDSKRKGIDRAIEAAAKLIELSLDRRGRGRPSKK